MTVRATAPAADETRPAAVPPERRGLRRRVPKPAVVVVFLLVSAVVIVVGLRVGESGISYGDVLAVLRDKLLGRESTVQAQVIVWELRMPRVLLAFFGGAALALSGTLMQGLLHNPLVEPYTLGISPAAGFGAALTILVTENGASTQEVLLVALASALTCGVLLLTMGAVRALSPTTLILLGIALTTMFIALTEALRYAADEQTLAAMVRWTFGSVNEARWTDVRVTAVLLLVVLPLVWWRSKDLNAIAFAGDDAASSLGVNVPVFRGVVMFAAITLAAVVVSFCGIIGFVGLVAPHMARLLIGGDHRYLVPFSAIFGGLMLTLADVIGRLVFAPAVIPVGIVVAFLGAPVFIYLVMTRRTAA